MPSNLTSLAENIHPSIISVARSTGRNALPDFTEQNAELCRRPTPCLDSLPDSGWVQWRVPTPCGSGPGALSAPSGCRTGRRRAVDAPASERWSGRRWWGGAAADPALPRIPRARRRRLPRTPSGKKWWKYYLEYCVNLTYNAPRVSAGGKEPFTRCAEIVLSPLERK